VLGGERAERLDRLVRDEEVVGYDVGRQVREEAVHERALAVVLAGLEHAQRDLPVVAVVQLLREVLADHDVGGAASVQVVVGVVDEKAAEKRAQERDVLEDLQPEVDVRGGAPGEGVRGPE
jgi:hypothetical protein